MEKLGKCVVCKKPVTVEDEWLAAGEDKKQHVHLRCVKG